MRIILTIATFLALSTPTAFAGDAAQMPGMVPDATANQSPAHAALEDRISKLEAEIVALRRQNAELASRIKQLSALLGDKGIPVAPADLSDSPGCLTRLHDLQRKHEAMLTMGLMEKHPDVINISAQIVDVQRDCAAYPSQN